MKFVLSVVVSLFSIGSALACSCSEWGSAQQMLKEADAVVLAIPVSDSKVDPSVSPRVYDSLGPIVKTDMKVVRHFKGKYKKFFYLYTEKDLGGNCGVNFKKQDGMYLVFAYMQNGRYFTESCSIGQVDSEDSYITKFISELL